MLRLSWHERIAPAIVFSVALTLAFASDVRAQSEFQRGDANGDLVLDISDGVAVLNFLFLGVSSVACDDALDTDDSGSLDLSDGIGLFNFLFLGGEPPRPPHEECGSDPSEDPLGCESYERCTPPEPCLGQAELDALVAENVPAEVCVPADQVFDLDQVSGVICPANTAAPNCGGGGPGCPVTLTEVRAELFLENLAQPSVEVVIAGEIEDIIVRINTLLGSTDCVTDIDFSGIAVIPIAIDEEPGGTLRLVSVGTATLDRERTTVNLNSGGGAICDIFEGLQGLFIDDLLLQLEAAANDSLAEFRSELQGEAVCRP